MLGGAGGEGGPSSGIRGRREANAEEPLRGTRASSSVTTSPAFNRRSARTKFSYPAPSMRKEYEPGGKSRKRKTPSAFAVIVRAAPAAPLVNVAVAPTIP